MCSCLKTKQNNTKTAGCLSTADCIKRHFFILLCIENCCGFRVDFLAIVTGSGGAGNVYIVYFFLKKLLVLKTSIYVGFTSRLIFFFFPSLCFPPSGKANLRFCGPVQVYILKKTSLTRSLFLKLWQNMRGSNLW